MSDISGGLHGDRRDGCMGGDVHQTRLRAEVPDALALYEQHGLAVCVTTDDRTRHVTPVWSEFAR